MNMVGFVIAVDGPKEMTERMTTFQEILGYTAILLILICVIIYAVLRSGSWI